MSTRLAVAAALTFVSGACFAQSSDVTFFVIGKHGNYSQDFNGERHSVDYSFFSEVFLTGNGDARDATLTFPTGEVVPFVDMRQVEGGRRDNILLISGEDRFTAFADLQNRYPDGEYRISFATPSGSVDDKPMLFADRPLPRPPQVTLKQGSVSNCGTIAPNVDLDVSWSPFSEGRDDPNGILNDLVFVILTDADGNRVAHSGRPFEGRPYLTWADTTFRIDGGVLLPDATYTLSVENALLDDTLSVDGVPAFTTRAVTTKVQLNTGTEEMAACTPLPPALDGQVTMFYYEDIAAASTFYGEVLGLENTLDLGWVRFYRTGPGSQVGLVTAGTGSWHPVRAENSVMLSMVTSDIAAWHERLAARDDVTFLKPLGANELIRSFLLEDPGGYAVEFFEWVEKPE